MAGFSLCVTLTVQLQKRNELHFGVSFCFTNFAKNWWKHLIQFMAWDVTRCFPELV